MEDFRMMSRKFVEAFIEKYESHPCLWKIDHPDYRQLKKREVAYKDLLTLLKQVDQKATKIDVLKKISTMRASQRKEFQKIKKSLEEATSIDDVYRPRLWYFGLLSFTIRSELATLTPNFCSTTVEKLAFSDNDQTCVATNTTQEPETTQVHTYEQEDFSQDSDNETLEPDLKKSQSNVLDSSRNSFFPIEFDIENKDSIESEDPYKQSELHNAKNEAEKKDMCELVAKNIAIKLGRLENRQKIFAEKLINDILFEAEFGTLDQDCRLFIKPKKLKGSEDRLS